MEKRELSNEFIRNVTSRYSDLKKRMKEAHMSFPDEIEEMLKNMSHNSQSTENLKHADCDSVKNKLLGNLHHSVTPSQVNCIYEEIKSTSKRLTLSENALSMKERENFELKMLVCCLKEQLEGDESNLEADRCNVCKLF